MRNQPDKATARAADISPRIRTLRTERHLSQRELARASGLSPNTLSLIERGEVSPTASTLQKLAGALGVTISAFFEPHEESLGTITLIRAAHRVSIQIADAEIERLGPSVEHAPVTPIVLKLEPGASSGTIMTHRGQEFAYCLNGQMLYLIEEQAYLLEPGDSLLFDATQSHRWQNPGAGQAEVLIVLVSPGGGIDTIMHRP